MAAKKIAAIIVAALVAGVVMGTLGIANAGGTVSLPGASADCSSCTNESGTESGACAEGVDACATGAGAEAVSDQAMQCPSTAATQAPAGETAPEGACGTGGCPDMQ